MATLFNTKIKDTYQSLLKLEDNTILTTTSKNITDGLGNASPLYMSTTQVRIGSTSASALYWDNVNNRLGIGTSSPTSTLDVVGNVRILNNGGLTFYNGGSIYSSHYITTANELLTVNSNNSYGAWKFTNYNVSIDKNLAIGTTLTDFVNPSQRLLIRGSGSTSATTSLLVQNSSGQQLLSVLDDGSCTIGISGSTTNSLTIVGNTGIQAIIGNTQFQSPQSIYRYGGGVLGFYGANNDGTAFSFDFNNAQGSTNVNSVMVNLGGTYQNQTSFQFANLRIAPVYNFNANTTTNAIARGIYYNPTITNLQLAQHRAIETVTGDVLFGTTSGLVGIGTIYTGWRLNVDGAIRAQRIDLTGSAGPGHVMLRIDDNGTVLRNNTFNINSGNGNAGQNANLAVGNFDSTLARLYVKGSGSTSATTSLLVQNSSGTTGFRVDDDSAVVIKSRVDSIDSTILFRAITSTALTLTASQTTIGNHTAFTNGFFDNLANTDYNFRMNTSGNAIAFRDPGRVWLNTTSSGTLIQNTSFGGTAIAASALLEVQSTTKGVLFPRMTTAQKLAIASPVGGLQVFDTTLNQMSYYNGSAWINF